MSTGAKKMNHNHTNGESDILMPTGTKEVESSQMERESNILTPTGTKEVESSQIERESDILMPAGTKEVECRKRYTNANLWCVATACFWHTGNKGQEGLHVRRQVHTANDVTRICITVVTMSNHPDADVGDVLNESCATLPKLISDL